MSERAIAAVAAAVPVSAGRLEVTGDGPLAQALRARLAAAPGAGAAPATIVETTGKTGAIRAALARVADLGTVVLAGPVAPGPVALDVYGDLHVRGLTLVAVAPDCDAAPAMS